MNRNITPIVLIVLAIGLYFTFTSGQYDAAKALMDQNTQYAATYDSSNLLLSKRDEVIKSYNAISEDNRERLKKLLPDHIDNIRLIIDINGVAARHGVTIKNVKTGASSDQKTGSASAAVPGTPSADTTAARRLQQTPSTSQYDTMVMDFNVTTTYDNFIEILRDLEKSLRIVDVSKVSFSPTDSGAYDFTVQLRTYWLRQN